MNDPSTHNQLSIYLVDDHMIFRQSFEAYLSTQEGFRFVGAGTGQEPTLQEILYRRPDIVLLDFHLDRGNGIDLLQKLRQAGYAGKVVFLTMNRDSRIRETVRPLGADGFVSKDVDGNALLAGLQSLLLHQTPYLEISDDVLSSLENPFQLTKQELKVARLVCSGLSSEEVAGKLFISIHTVHTHRRRILEKTASGTFIEVCRKLQ